MTKSLRIKHFVAPALLTLAALGLGSGCSSAKDALGGNCGSGDAGASLTATFDTFKASVTALQSVEGKITSKVALACVGIAKDLGTDASTLPTVTDGTPVSKEDTDKACKAASDAIAAVKASASASVTITASAPVCTVDAKAQVDCNANCNVSAHCDPPSITTACEAGHLSGGCSGQCQGSCTAKLDAAASCTGTCNGTCEGTCAGQAGTAGNGVACNGECNGSCKGDCTAKLDASATCSGTCQGSCSVDFQAPKCDVAIKQADCSAAADCNAGCSGSASVKATCTEPTVDVAITGSATATATLQATLKKNLPALLAVAAQAKLAGQSVLDMSTAAGKVGVAFAAETGCVVKYGADFAANLSAAVKSSANVNASFSASVSVSGSASGSTS